MEKVAPQGELEGEALRRVLRVGGVGGAGVVDGERSQSRKRAGSAVSVGRFLRRYDQDERGD